MHKFSSKALVSGFCAALGPAAAGCSQLATLQATMAFKDANQLYRGQDFRAAVESYAQGLKARRDPEMLALRGWAYLQLQAPRPALLDFDFRESAGVCLRVRTAWFLLRGDYGFVLDPRPGEKRQRFYFSIGQAF